MRSLLTLLVIAATGCLMAPAMPVTTNPQATGHGATAGLGMTTNFHATLKEDGVTKEVVYWPRKTILALETIGLAARRSLNAPCDAGGQLAIGGIGASVRCGRGSTPSFDCSGCVEPHSFEAFDPGWRLGVAIGLTTH